MAGKTGTTENYGDAWFVGWTKELTVAVWVGYPDELRPMQTEFNGQPVAGGTYPGGDLEVVHGHRRSDYDEYGDEGRGAGRTRPRRPRRRPETPGTTAPTDARAGARRRGAERRRAAAPAPAPEPPAPDDRAAPEAPAEQQQPAEQAPAGGVAAPGSRYRGRCATRAAGAARAGHGRDTLRDPIAQKRHSSSGAFVIPMRVPDDERDVLPAGRPRADPDRPGARGRCR